VSAVYAVLSNNVSTVVKSELTTAEIPQNLTLCKVNYLFLIDLTHDAIASINH